MKKTLLFIICCIFSSVSYAQIEAGNKYFGGTLGGNIQSHYGDQKSSSMSIKPAIGYFLSENWMVGLQTELKFSNIEGYTISQQRSFLIENNSRAVSLGPVVRYYHSIGTKFSVFTEGNSGFTSIKNEQKSEMQPYYSDPYTYHTGFNISYTTKQLYAGFAPGLVFFPKPKLGLELKANILTFSHSLKSNNEYSQFNPVNPKTNFNANLTLASTSIGLGYYF